MSKYEYLGKKEIYKRVKALGYEMSKISDFNYIKYDCIEWMESHELKITVQRGGEWLQVVESAHTFTRSRYFVTTWPENISRVTTRDIFISLFDVLSSCRKLSGYKSGCCSTLTN